jgi:AcrR family transcriptional regulator
MTGYATPSTRRRPYRMVRRLASIEETRQRITAAAFDLHATIGPSRTTISAIADRAGVQRHTVYAHFADLEALYRACTEHGMRVTGMPEPGPWTEIADPVARLRHGLRELFAWYRENERMLLNVLHDFDPYAPPPTEPDLFQLRMESLAEALTDGWSVAIDDARPTLAAVLAHAMGFETWRSLSGTGLQDEAAVDLLASIAVAAARGTLATDG